MKLLIKIFKKNEIRKIQILAVILVVVNVFYLAFAPYGLKYIMSSFSAPTTSVQEVEQKLKNGDYVKLTTDNIYYTEYYYGTSSVIDYYIMYSMDDDGYLVYFMDSQVTDRGYEDNEFDGPGTATILLKRTSLSNTDGIIDDIIDNWDYYYADYGFDRESITAYSSYVIGEIVYEPSGLGLVGIGAYIGVNAILIGLIIFFYIKSLSIDKDPTFVELMNSGKMSEIELDIDSPEIDVPFYVAGNRFIILKKAKKMSECIIDTKELVWGYLHTQHGNNSTAITVLMLYYDGDKKGHAYPVQSSSTQPSQFIELISRKNPDVIFKYHFELVKFWNENPSKEAFLELFKEKEGTTA